MKEKTVWHDRFTNQLKWTKKLRELIYSRLAITHASKILEPGCGTGALLIELGTKFKSNLNGIDIDTSRLAIAKYNIAAKNIDVTLEERNVLDTGFKDSSFDFIFTHYLFLWVIDLQKAFNELHRILKPNGKLIIFAEPDYGGTIEEPNFNLKQAIQSNLEEQGSNPNVGREIPRYWKDIFKIVDQFSSSIPWLALNRKSQLLQEVQFLSNILHEENFDPEKICMAIKNDDYFLYIPVFSYILEKAM